MFKSISLIKLILICVILFTIFPVISPAGEQASLAPGITDVRPGLQAYSDLWHLCFWNDGMEAGMMSSHDEDDRNIDLMHFHGVHDGGKILADVKGPGVVYRIWSAGPTGDLLFYVDGDDDPVIECPFDDYMEGRCFSESTFHAGRDANYTPVPFEESLIVTAKKFKLEGAYYQVSYMTFDEDPGIKSVDSDKQGQGGDELNDAVKFFKSAGKEPGRDLGGISQSKSGTIELHPGKPFDLSLDGTGILTELSLINPDNPADPVEDVVMKIRWDGENEVSVDSPVDAFFGNRFDSRAGGKKIYGPYETLIHSANKTGYKSRWPMPFGDGMTITFVNNGDSKKRLKVKADYRVFDVLPKNTMRFHARYKEIDYPNELTKDKIHGILYQVDQSTNYVMLDRPGKGYYVGCFLYVRSLGRDWWGEGDEMVWVDGQKKALIRGTGTEDEFNWSFGFKINSSPLSGALTAKKAPKNTPPETFGYNVLYRYRLGDFIPFEEDIKVTYERLGTTTKWMKRYPGAQANVSHHRGDDYRSVAFWYELHE